MFPPAQIEGASEAIEAAAKQGSEAVLVAVVLLGALAALSWLVRTCMQQAGGREERMGMRITRLEDQIQTTLMVLVKDTAEALRLTSKSTDDLREVVKELHDALLQRPCLLEESEVERVKKNHKTT